jgi:hypothetical protein
VRSSLPELTIESFGTLPADLTAELETEAERLAQARGFAEVVLR